MTTREDLLTENKKLRKAVHRLSVDLGRSKVTLIRIEALAGEWDRSRNPILHVAAGRLRLVLRSRASAGDEPAHYSDQQPETD